MKEEPRQPQLIDISAKSIFKFLLISVLFIALFILRDLVLVILVAIILATAIEPITLFFKKYRIARVPAVMITYGAFLGLFFGVFYFFIPTVLDETSTFLSQLPKYLESTKIISVNDNPTISNSQKVVADLSAGITRSQQAIDTAINNASTNQNQNAVSDLAKLPSSLADNVLTRGSALRDFVSNVNKAAGTFSDSFMNTISLVFGGVTSFIIMLVLSFYLAAQERGIEKFIRIVAPLDKEEYIIDLWQRSQKKIGLWMQGQLLLAVLIGVLVFLGLTILGVPNALLLALLAAVFEVIPLFGPILSAIPGILFGYASGGFTLALLVTGLYIIIQQFESHLIYPLVVRKIVGVPAIIVVISMVIGWELAGFVGLLISVPMVTALMEYFNDIEKFKIRMRKNVL